MHPIHSAIPAKMYVTAIVKGGAIDKVLSFDLEPNAKAVASHNDSKGREGDAVCVQVSLTEAQRHWIESAIKSRALRVMNKKIRAEKSG